METKSRSPSPLTQTGVCAGMPSARKVTRSTNGSSPSTRVEVVAHAPTVHAREAETSRGPDPRAAPPARRRSPRVPCMSDDGPPPPPTRPWRPRGRAPRWTRRRRSSSAVIGLVVLVIIFVKVIPQIGCYEDAFIAIQAMNALRHRAHRARRRSSTTRVYGFPFMAAAPGLSYAALVPAQPGRVRDQQRHPRRRRLRPRRAVRDARVVRGAADRRDGRHRRHRRVERVRHARPAGLRRLMLLRRRLQRRDRRTSSTPPSASARPASR